jgi:hypothetical protein
VGFVELGELLEGIFANDIGIENKKWRIIFSKNLLCKLERASRP